MTGNIPEIIRKLMYSYNSHPIVDLLKVDEKFKKLRERSDIFNNQTHRIICFDCGEVIDYLQNDSLCLLCRRFDEAERLEELRFHDELLYDGSDDE